MDAHRLLVRRLKKVWNRLSIPFWRLVLFHDFQRRDHCFPTMHDAVDVLLSTGMTVETWDTYWKSRESFFIEIASYSHQTRWKMWRLWDLMKQEKQIHLFHPSVKIELCTGCTMPMTRRIITCSSSVMDYNENKVTLVDSQSGQDEQHFICGNYSCGFYMPVMYSSWDFIYSLVLSRWLWKQERLLEYSTFLQCFTHPVPKTPLDTFRNHKLCDDCVVTHVIRSFITS
jgi:hypothetical protein